MIRIHYMKNFNKIHFLKKEEKRWKDMSAGAKRPWLKCWTATVWKNINELKNIQGRHRGWSQNHVVYSAIKRIAGVQEN